jgi:hypothetical protein
MNPGTGRGRGLMSRGRTTICRGMPTICRTGTNESHRVVRTTSPPPVARGPALQRSASGLQFGAFRRRPPSFLGREDRRLQPEEGTMNAISGE